jgi:hypothetical protein
MKKEPRSIAFIRAKRAKEERDQGKVEALASLEVHNHNGILRFHEEK